MFKKIKLYNKLCDEWIICEDKKILKYLKNYQFKKFLFFLSVFALPLFIAGVIDKNYACFVLSILITFLIESIMFKIDNEELFLDIRQKATTYFLKDKEISKVRYNLIQKNIAIATKLHKKGILSKKELISLGSHNTTCLLHCRKSTILFNKPITTRHYLYFTDKLSKNDNYYFKVNNLFINSPYYGFNFLKYTLKNLLDCFVISLLLFFLAPSTENLIVIPTLALFIYFSKSFFYWRSKSYFFISDIDDFNSACYRISSFNKQYMDSYISYTSNLLLKDLISADIFDSVLIYNSIMVRTVVS